MTLSIAVIGSGMAGLAAAFGCREAGHQVTTFEANKGFGMDAHTLNVDGGIVDVPLRVMSPGGWKSVLNLAARVGVETFPVTVNSSCSWSDQRSWFRSGRVPLTGWPFVGSWRYLNTHTARLPLELLRLSRLTNELRQTQSGLTLAQLLRQESFDPLFWRGLVLPLLTTICTCSEEHLLAWPAGQLLAMLNGIIHGDDLCRLKGGTSALVAALSRELNCISGSPVNRVSIEGDKVEVFNDHGDGGLFDRVIIATQANQLSFLNDAQFAREKKVLQDIRFDTGELLVHRDPRFMPRRKQDWSALNFQMDRQLTRPMFTVWVNDVEPTLRDKAPVFQTWNPLYEPEAGTVIARVSLQRAVVHQGTSSVHQQLREWHAQPGRKVFFCGAWAYDGVPLLESAVRSSEVVVAALKKQAASLHSMQS